MKLLKDMFIPPKGYSAAGFSSGLKEKGKRDTAIIASNVDASWAGTFTTNKVRAACVDRNEKLLGTDGPVKGIIINSSNANACTGTLGIKKNEDMADLAAELLGTPPKTILTASTGVIGVQLPLEKIKNTVENKKISDLVSKNGFDEAAEAILTTDTFAKKASVKFHIGDKEVILSGMAKGSGMIHPNMATMLSFITTDLSISKSLLVQCLREVVDDTFNMISVDGDTSTNDMVLILSNGLAGNDTIDNQGENYVIFKKALGLLATYLAKAIVSDGEGATKLLEVEVIGAKSRADAKLIAKSVVTSNLVKTAFFGMDPNWGRIIAAVGYSGADFGPENISIYIQGAPGYSCLMEHGEPHHFDMDSVLGILKEKNITITVKLEDGNYSAVAWGCDLSYDYVKINAEYTT